jgi:LemA protein
MKHESTVLTNITNARATAMQATTINDKIAAETQLSSALQGLKVAVEAYPDLKANQSFIHLQEEISDIENKLAAARRFFNSATKELNNAVETFPSNLLADMFGFKREPMFDLGTDQRAKADEAPKLNF